jgi:nitrogen-specific signal transduction histidine kinase
MAADDRHGDQARQIPTQKCRRLGGRSAVARRLSGDTAERAGREVLHDLGEAAVDHVALAAADGLDRIFDPFFTTKSHGTSLGLATCHAIVAEHQGHIDVENTAGTGTKMLITLPRPT